VVNGLPLAVRRTRHEAIDAVIKPFELDEVKDRLGAGQRPYGHRK